MTSASATRTAARERSAAHVSVLLEDQLDDRALDALLRRLEAIYGQATAILGGDATTRTVIDLTGADALTLDYEAERRLIATLLEQLCVADALVEESLAYLTLVSSPGEVAIAGDPAACRRVIARLGCESARSPINYVLHCEPMHTEYDTLVRLYTQPVTPDPDITFYSAADYAPVVQESERIAESIAQEVCQPLDFPRLVERAYADGVRAFVELGPASACSRWIGRTLGGREHVAVSLNRRGVDDYTGLVRALAVMVSHGLQVDLAPLLQDPETASPRTLVRRVSTGGPRIRDTIRAFHFNSSPMLKKDDRVPTLLPSSNTTRAHVALLESRRQGLDQIGALVARELAAAERLLSTPPALKPTPIWDENDLLEFAGGEIASVFGPEYAPIDTFRRRVRLPTPPYLLVSRVTRLDAQRGRFERSSMTTEYDVPRDAWYCVDGQVPWAVTVESGQSDLMLISYLGVDFENRGERVYRLLDCTLTFMDALPMEGDTLRYDISINSFARTASNLLFFFSYECFVGERLILKMDGGCAGFFSDAELAQGRGVLDTHRAVNGVVSVAKTVSFCAPLACTRRSFGRDDLLALARGDVAACFGPGYASGGRACLGPAELLMVDRIVSVDPTGGCAGLGLVVADKDISAEDWYFACHFKDDQVLAGTLIAQGCVQLLSFYMLYLGLQVEVGQDARFQPILHRPQSVRCRGQVTPRHSLMRYRLEVLEVGVQPMPFARANVDVLVGDSVVIRFEDVGLRLVDNSATRPRLVATERQIAEFATGSVVACFGPEYAMYVQRRTPRTPNGALQLISRVVEILGERRNPRPGATLVAEYDVPVDAWFVTQNSTPEVPYSMLMEMGMQPCGFLSAWLGTTLSDPETDFYFRNLDGHGALLRCVDIRGQTVSNRVRLVASTAIEGVIIQRFAFELSCAGAPFYAGEAAFGYFTRPALAQQIGLDGGAETAAWLSTASDATAPVILDLDAARHLYRGRPGAAHYRLPGGRLELLDRVVVVEHGGAQGLGYAYAERRVRADDWFFGCHFYQDPVMPGSLGVEAMLEALQVYSLQCGLGADLRSPCFRQAAGHTVTWKYRGQILPETPWMRLEVHVTRVERCSDGAIILTATGNLWRDNLRIYEVHDLALRIEEAGNAC